MICSACGVQARFEDGFCSACGVEQPASRLPMKRQLPAFPAVWRDAAPALARGAALIAAGVAAEFLLRSMARGAMHGRAVKEKPRAVARKEIAVFEEIVAVSQTVVTRRIVVRR